MLQGTCDEMFTLTFADTTQEDIDKAQQAFDDFAPLEDEPEFTAGACLPSLLCCVLKGYVLVRREA